MTDKLDIDPNRVCTIEKGFSCDNDFVSLLGNIEMFQRMIKEQTRCMLRSCNLRDIKVRYVIKPLIDNRTLFSAEWDVPYHRLHDLVKPQFDEKESNE